MPKNKFWAKVVYGLIQWLLLSCVLVLLPFKMTSSSYIPVLIGVAIAAWLVLMVIIVAYCNHKILRLIQISALLVCGLAALNLVEFYWLLVVALAVWAILQVLLPLEVRAAEAK